MMKFNQQIVILLFIFLVVQEKSCSVARPVEKVNLVLTRNEMAIEGVARDSHDFSLQKETGIVSRIGGRKMRGEAMKWRSRKISHSVRNYGKGDEEGNVMAFSSDYHPPKPHPPKNN